MFTSRCEPCVTGWHPSPVDARPSMPRHLFFFFFTGGGLDARSARISAWCYAGAPWERRSAGAPGFEPMCQRGSLDSESSSLTTSGQALGHFPCGCLLTGRPALDLWPAGPKSFKLMPTCKAALDQLAGHALRKRMVTGSIPVGGSCLAREHTAGPLALCGALRPCRAPTGPLPLGDGSSTQPL